MLIIREDELTRVLSMEAVVETVEQAQRDYACGRITLPGRVTMDLGPTGAGCIFLPACRPPYYSLKQASSLPDNPGRGLSTVLSDIHLYSAETGQLLALISAGRLTALKTGAASAVATKYLARPDAEVLAVIGTGVQARTQLQAIALVRRLREVRLFDLDPRRAETFAQWARQEMGEGCRVVRLDSVSRALTGAHIVCTCTPSSRPVLRGDDLAEGCHLNAVGSFTPQMQEIDERTVLRADKIVCDRAEDTWQVAGDLLVPLEKGLIGRDALYSELGLIVDGQVPGRQDPAEITIYESVGFAALDLAVAVEAYQRALQTKVGIEVDW